MACQNKINEFILLFNFKINLTMKELIKLLLASLILSSITSCNENSLTTNEELTEGEISLKKASDKPVKITGDIEVSKNNETQENNNGSQPENLRYFLDITAQEETEKQDVKGEIYYLVTLEDKTVHRKIYATVTNVIQGNGNFAYIIALVESDTKETTTDSEGGHDSYTTEEDDTTHDATTNGKNSRVGQFIGMKINDGGSPGAGNDKISWKWFDYAPETSEIPGFGNDKKEVVGGNLTIHNQQEE